MTSARRQALFGLFFVAPFALVWLCFLVIPLVFAFWWSLHGRTLGGAETFRGLQNYLNALADPDFRTGLSRVMLFALMVVPVQLVVGSITALVLDSLESGISKAVRLVMFVPYAVPSVIGALMWGFIYSPAFGPAKAVSDLLGVPIVPLSPSSILFALLNIVVWQGAGYYMLILLAGLKGIDPSLHEAARLDGASRLQIALRIQLPLLRPALLVIAMFSLIGALQLFAEPQAIRPIAAGSIDSAFTPNLYAYNLAFSFQQPNYAAAISFVLGLAIFVATLLIAATGRRSAGA